MAGMRKLTRRASPGNIHPFLKQAHEITSAAIMRELKRRKLGQRELKHARKFLELNRYNRKGLWPKRYAQVYDIALQMAQNGNTRLLGHIGETALKITRLAQRSKFKEGLLHLSANPAIGIIYATKTARTFLEKDGVEELKKEIDSSNPSSRLKARLYRYLGEK